jgi:hypothetical protein
MDGQNNHNHNHNKQRWYKVMDLKDDLKDQLQTLPYPFDLMMVFAWQ